MSDKTHGFGWRFIHSGEASSVILRTREHAAHMASHMFQRRAEQAGFIFKSTFAA